MLKNYYFNQVESVLASFPQEYSKNYYENKNDLVINIEESVELEIYGAYQNEENLIEIYGEKNIKSLTHELFHMAFRDKEKAGKKIWVDSDIYYGNGVSYKITRNGKKRIVHVGLTEGFVEYLDRKCNENSVLEDYRYFFVDLLISIYGEEILKYPLQNDPIGLLSDKRFYDIFTLSKSLDKAENSLENMVIMLNFIKETAPDEKINKEHYQKILEIAKSTKEKFKCSIISCFQNIINEYENCKNPNINKENFIIKMERFLSYPNYEAVFLFDDEKYCVKDKVIAIINDFKKDKTKLETLLYKIKRIKK